MRRRTPAPLAAAVLLLWSAASALAAPPARTAPADPASSANPAGRWIVMLKPGTDAVAAAAKQGKKASFKPDRLYRSVVKGYAAHLDPAQLASVRTDPTVAAVVPDERIELEAQTMPTGITRVGADRSSVARIDGSDERVDADVAIVDTGIATVPDLNVAGGINCSTSDPTAWRDKNGHGTHVSGTVGAIDNGSGVVGVAPGVRLWAVKILNDSGDGLLSWYVCGLDWIASQRDPSDASRPLFEAVNMSVAKWGADDNNCGATNHDILHAAICRLVKSGVTVVAAAGNDSRNASARVPAAYNEVITVSALADTDGKPGGLGGHRCFSWGTYDQDDTFADFSNYGADVDLIAPGKCIWSTVPGGYQYLSGTSMAAPHVTGAVALLKASRPDLTPAEVKEALHYLGSTNWNWRTDPDPYHEKLLDVSRIGPRGDFSIAVGSAPFRVPNGGTVRIPVTIVRTPTLFERIRLAVDGLPQGAAARFDLPAPFGFAQVASNLYLTVPSTIQAGSYQIVVTGTEHDHVRQATATLDVFLDTDLPTAQPPTPTARTRATISATSIPTTIAWPAATDPTTPIAAYEVQRSVDGTAWAPVSSTSGSVRSLASQQNLNHAYTYRVRARDAAGNWSDWARGPSVTAALVQDSSASVRYSGTWHRAAYSLASGGSTTWSSSAGAQVQLSFRGRGIALVAPVGPYRGAATISVDGVSRGTFSFRAAAAQSRMVMFATSFATVGSHSITLRLTSNTRVDLDAFVILR